MSNAMLSSAFDHVDIRIICLWRWRHKHLVLVHTHIMSDLSDTEGDLQIETQGVFIVMNYIVFN